MALSDVLAKIIARKHEEIAERKAQCSLEQIKEKASLASAPRGFLKAMQAKVAAGENAVIAEIKKASPSKGVIREDFNPVEIAKSYQNAGAACLSVLTDKDFFQGCEQFLVDARGACELPVIRKDFIVDDYQVYEARSIGADCILLIVAAFMDKPETLKRLYKLATELGMDVLVEVHDKPELELALTLNCPLLGINNRNLNTFETSLQNTIGLLPMVPSTTLLVTESGIHTQEDVAFMKRHDIHAFLVGEAFMRAPSPGDALKALFS